MAASVIQDRILAVPSNPKMLLKATLAVLCIAVFAGSSGKAQQNASEAGTTHLLAIAVCPPYRKDVPVELCHNALKAVTDDFPGALGVDPSNVTTMVDAETTGENVLAKLSELETTLDEKDRLVLYILLHGDPYYEWADYYESGPIVERVGQAYTPSHEDLMVFWTEDSPTVPALALAQKDWLTVPEFADALNKIPARVALIFDSCASNLYFRSVHEHAKMHDNIDYVATAAAGNQVSLFDQTKSMPLFLQQLRASLSMPDIRTFGEAMNHARASTVVNAMAQCSLSTIPSNLYQVAFPNLPTPNHTTHDGQVSVPLWYCSQIPNVVDYTGEISERPLYQIAQ